MAKKGFKTFITNGRWWADEGSIYEAAMSASHYKLDNLVAIIDRNTLQISGKTENVGARTYASTFRKLLVGKFDVNGNDMEAIIECVWRIWYSERKTKTDYFTHTTKGNGISYMEHGAKWRHGVLTENSIRPIAEIEERIKTMCW